MTAAVTEVEGTHEIPKNRQLRLLPAALQHARLRALVVQLLQLRNRLGDDVLVLQHDGWHLGDLYAESGQTLQVSFSAVSKPNFASKYALESSRRDLHNALLCTALKSHFFKKNARYSISLKFANFFRNFAEFAEFCKI